MENNNKYLVDTDFNLKGNRELKCLFLLEKKDICYVKSNFFAFGLDIDVGSIKNILDKKNTKNKATMPMQMLDYDDKTCLADYGDIFVATTNLGKYLKENEQVLREFCVNYYQNLLTNNVINYCSYRMTTNIPNTLLSMEGIEYPSFFRSEWKQDVNFDYVKNGKLVPLLKKSDRLKTLILKWIAVCGLLKSEIDINKDINTIDIYTLFKIFEYCLKCYTDYFNYTTSDKISSKKISMDFIVSKRNDGTYKFDREFHTLDDAYYFELFSIENHSHLKLQLCENCKEFYYGDSRQKACSTRCRDKLSRKYEKRKNKHDKTGNKGKI